MTKPKELIPPDMNQCQTEVPNGHTFMTLGGTPGLKRCTNKAMHLLIEKEPGSDGQRGSMTVCDDCLKVFSKQGDMTKVLVKTLPRRNGVWEIDMLPMVHPEADVNQGMLVDWLIAQLNTTRKTLASLVGEGRNVINQVDVEQVIWALEESHPKHWGEEHQNCG